MPKQWNVATMNLAQEYFDKIVLNFISDRQRIHIRQTVQNICISWEDIIPASLRCEVYYSNLVFLFAINRIAVDANSRNMPMWLPGKRTRSIRRTNG